VVAGAGQLTIHILRAFFGFFFVAGKNRKSVRQPKPAYGSDK